jgi:hypothetical protein
MTSGFIWTHEGRVTYTDELQYVTLNNTDIHDASLVNVSRRPLGGIAIASADIKAVQIDANTVWVNTYFGYGMPYTDFVGTDGRMLWYRTTNGFHIRTFDELTNTDHSFIPCMTSDVTKKIWFTSYPIIYRDPLLYFGSLASDSVYYQPAGRVVKYNHKATPVSTIGTVRQAEILTEVLANYSNPSVRIDLPLWRLNRRAVLFSDTISATVTQAYLLVIDLTTGDYSVLLLGSQTDLGEDHGLAGRYSYSGYGAILDALYDPTYGNIFLHYSDYIILIAHGWTSDVGNNAVSINTTYIIYNFTTDQISTIALDTARAEEFYAKDYISPDHYQETTRLYYTTYINSEIVQLGTDSQQKILIRQDKRIHTPSWNWDLYPDSSYMIPTTSTLSYKYINGNGTVEKSDSLTTSAVAWSSSFSSSFQYMPEDPDVSFDTIQGRVNSYSRAYHINTGITQPPLTGSTYDYRVTYRGVCEHGDIYTIDGLDNYFCIVDGLSGNNTISYDITNGVGAYGYAALVVQS